MITWYDDNVRLTFQGYPPEIRQQLLVIRDLILTTASQIKAVGEIEETLKWGEPAYLTSESGSGSTIRLGWKSSSPRHYRMLVHCQTSLIDTFRTLYPDLQFEGNRAIVFQLGDELPKAALTHCIEIALTYHSAKRAPRGNKRSPL